MTAPGIVRVKKSSLVKNAGDEGQVRAATETVQFRTQQAVRRRRLQLSTVDGRATLWEVLGDCRSYESAMAGDPYQTAYNCGRQDVGRLIERKYASASPADFLTMQREAAQLEDTESTPPDTEDPDA